MHRYLLIFFLFLIGILIGQIAFLFSTEKGQNILTHWTDRVPSILSPDFDPFMNADAIVIPERLDPQAMTATGLYLSSRHAQLNNEWSQAFDYLKELEMPAPLTEGEEQNVPASSRLMILAVGSGHMIQALEIANSLLQTSDITSEEKDLVTLIEISDSFSRKEYSEALSRISELNPSALNSLIIPLLKFWANAGAQKDLQPGVASLNIVQLLHKALAEEALGHSDRAELLFDKIMTLLPNQSISMEAAAFYIRNNQPLKAEKILKELSETTSYDFNRISSWRQHIEAGTIPSMPDYTRHISAGAYAGAAEAFHSLAQLLILESSFDSALIFAQLANHVDPDTNGITLTFADIYNALGKSKIALETLKNATEEDADYIEIKISQSEILNELERHDEALEILTPLIKDYSNVDLLFAYAETLRSSKQYEDAINAYTQAETLAQEQQFPAKTFWSLYYIRGICYDKTDQWDQAEADLKKALELQPDNPHILNYLGYSWAEDGIHLDEALDMLETAVELAPEDGYITDSMAWVLYQLGRVDESLPYIKTAISLLPYDPTVNDHIGDIYWTLGRRIEAKYQWRRALENADPEEDAELIEGLKQKLESGLAK